MEDTSRIRLRQALASLAVALACAAGCTRFSGGKSSLVLRDLQGGNASEYLEKVRKDPDPNKRYVAYAKLARPRCYESAAQKAEAVRLLTKKYDESREPIATRAVIVQTLGELRDPAARKVVLEAVNDPEPIIRVQGCRALGKVGRDEDATVLARIMATDIEDCKIAAIEAIGTLKTKDQRISKVLVTAMRHDDPAIRLASLNALRSITGKDLGTDVTAWAKLLPPDAADDASKAQLAANGADAAPPPLVLTSPPAAPVYPPRPAPIVDPRVDADAQTVSAPAGAPGLVGNQRNTLPIGTGGANYPTHNPNLPGPAGAP